MKEGRNVVGCFLFLHMAQHRKLDWKGRVSLRGQMFEWRMWPNIPFAFVETSRCWLCESKPGRGEKVGEKGLMKF